MRHGLTFHAADVKIVGRFFIRKQLRFPTHITIINSPNSLLIVNAQFRVTSEGYGQIISLVKDTFQ